MSFEGRSLGGSQAQHFGLDLMSKGGIRGWRCVADVLVKIGDCRSLMFPESDVFDLGNASMKAR